MNNESQPQFLISIIIATYNAEKYIEACLNSICEHTGVSIEVVVMDGGSTDQTLGILSKFKNSKLKWRSEADGGIYDALNKGVQIAGGKWIYFMGADDRLLPGFTALANKLDDEDTVYYGNSVPFYEDGATDSYGLLTGPFNSYRLSKYCMNHQSILYPREAFNTYQYELKYKVYADYAFNIRLWGDKTFKKKFYPIDIVSYNMGGFSAGNEDSLFNNEKSMLIRNNMGPKVFLRYLVRSYKDRLKFLYNHWLRK